MKTPEVGDRIRYRRPGGGKPVIYEGDVVSAECGMCTANVVHVMRLPERETLHHVPPQYIVAVIPGGAS